MTSRRDRWAQYYAQAVPMAIRWMQVADICKVADDMLAAEETRFGPFPAEPVQRPQPVTLECARAGAAPSGTKLRVRPDGLATEATGVVVGFAAGTYRIRDTEPGMTPVEWGVSPCNVLDVVLDDDRPRTDAELLEDDVRTLEERTAQLKLERDEARARADELDAALAAVANEGERQLTELRAQLAGCVPVAELRAAVTSMLDHMAYDGGISSEMSRALLDAAGPVSRLLEAAEQRAAAQTGEA